MTDDFRPLPLARSPQDRARRLAELLEELADSLMPMDFQSLHQEDLAGDLLEITRVEPGALWFGDVGPVPVPEEASSLAEPGWTARIVLARMPGGWRVLEAGEVSPA